MTERLGIRNEHWNEFKEPSEFSPIYNTGISRETMAQVSAALTTLPEGFTLHRQVAKMMREKEATLASGEGINWATAEALALGSLMLEGRHVRITGQDVEVRLAGSSVLGDWGRASGGVVVGWRG